MKAIDIYDNVDYLHITSRNKTLLQFGSEINGKKKSEVQALIGIKLGEGRYNYSLKIENDGKIYRGTIRGFIPEDKKQKKDTVESIEIESLKHKIEDMNKSGIDVDKLFSMQEKVFNNQMSFLSKQIELQQKQIETLQKSNNDSNGMDLTSLILPLLMNKGKATMTLNDPINNKSYNLPDRVIEVISKIDFNKLTDEQIESLSNQLDKLIGFAGLPKKEG